MVATGVSLTIAAGIVLAPSSAEASPSFRTAPVVLTGAWQDLADHTEANLADLAYLISHYPPAPILTQIAENQVTYARWLAGQDGGSPALVVRTMADHLLAVGTVVANIAVFMPLSLVGAFVSPAAAAIFLVQATAKYPSTPQTWLQALIDAPAVYLDTTFNCCSTPLFNAAFGLLNPGPIGLLLSLPISIAQALTITPATSSATSSPAGQAVGQTAGTNEAGSSPAAPATQRVESGSAVASGVGQSRRPHLDTTARQVAATRSAKRSAAAQAAGHDQQAPAQGKGRSARGVRPGNPGTR
ncbi:hypothetical protein ACXDF8_00075 [Mycolicibacterium sp. CBM1]